MVNNDTAIEEFRALRVGVYKPALFFKALWCWKSLLRMLIFLIYHFFIHENFNLVGREKANDSKYSKKSSCPIRFCVSEKYDTSTWRDEHRVIMYVVNVCLTTNYSPQDIYMINRHNDHKNQYLVLRKIIFFAHGKRSTWKICQTQKMLTNQMYSIIHMAPTDI